MQCWPSAGAQSHTISYGNNCIRTLAVGQDGLAACRGLCQQCQREQVNTHRQWRKHEDHQWLLCDVCLHSTHAVNRSKGVVLCVYMCA